MAYEDVKSLFLAGRDLAPAQRAALLDQRCADDAELRRAVERMLDAHDRSDGPLPPSPAEVATGSVSTEAVSGSAASLPEVGFPGYRVLRELSRGGQGVVYQAIQETTKRKVAIKVLREGRFANAGERARFQREVEILGQLKHPNIVTIYESGSAGGNAYYVMDYVAGQALDEWIADFRLQIADLEGAAPEPRRSGRAVGKPRADAQREITDLLRLFAKICDAVHAAHLRGILHRDLKPSNIRIDANGEPHVLDFGLAKLAGGPDDSPAMTLTGQFVGSLPWSSPEQARGMTSEIDIRTDVYSLGVILYQMLTGKFPYDVTGNVRDVLDRVMRAEPGRPSTVNRHIDDEVETIVLKCLAKERERRYQSAGEVARDICHYLADEAIEAKRDSAGYVLRKQLQRHKVPVAIAVAFIILIGLSSAAISVLYRHQLRETARAEAALKETQQVVAFQASQLRSIDVPGMGVRVRKHLLDEAEAAMRRQHLSDDEINAGRAQFEKRLTGMNLTNVVVKQLDGEIFERSMKGIEDQFASQTLVKAQLLQILAETLRELGLLERATTVQKQALVIRRSALGHDHPDTLTTLHSMGLLLRKRGKLAEAEPYYREALDGQRRVLGDDHQQTLASMNNLGDLLQARGKLPEAELCYRDTLERSRRVLGDEHSSTLVSISSLGSLLQQQGRLDEAEAYVREAFETSRRVLDEGHPRRVASINNIGELLHAQGKLDEAEPYYREALEKRRRILGDEHPLTLNCIDWLGRLLIDQGKLDEAEPYCREALDGRRRVLGDEHPDTLQSIHNMGNLFDRWDKPSEAERYFRDALETERRVLGDEHPDTLDSIHALGVLLRLQGKFAEAEPYCRAALESSRRVLGGDHFLTHVSTHSMGILLRLQGKPAEAIALLAPREPSVRRHFTEGKERRLGTFLTALGRARAAAGAFDAAERNLNEAHAILASAPNAFPRHRAEVLTGLAELYEAWNATEPGRDYDAKAAEWRAKLKELEVSTQPAADPERRPPK